MTNEREEHSGPEREALGRVASLPAPTPSPAAREQARGAFLTGTDARRAIAERRRRFRPATAGTIGAIAAGIALVVLVVGNRSPDRWRVVGVSAGDAVLLDDRTPEIATHFGEARGRTGSDGKLDVQLGERVRVVVTPESDVRFPSGPGRWWDRTRVLRVEAGEICATTQGHPLGFELVIETPEAETRVLGTTFAITRDAKGTHVALYEGRIDVVDKSDGSRHRVNPLARLDVHADGTPAASAALTEDEHAMLERMRTMGMAP